MRVSNLAAVLYGTIHWKDVTRARQLINHGMEEINDNPTVASILTIVRELIELIPEEERTIPNIPGLHE